MVHLGWIIFLLVVLCLLALAVINDFREPLVHNPLDHKSGVAIVLNDVVIDKLYLNPNFVQKESAITKFYMKQIQRTPEQITNNSIIDAHQDNIATLNVHAFEPINLNYTLRECMEAPFQLMHKFNISILGLQEFPIRHVERFLNVLNDFSLKYGPIYHSIDDFELAFKNSKEPIANIVLSRYPIIKEKKVILPSEPEWIYRHRYAVFFRVPEHPLGSKLFCLTHLEVGHPPTNNFTNIQADQPQNIDQQVDQNNIRGRKNQIHEIFKYDNKGPDIIMGDLNFQPASAAQQKPSPEWALMATQYKLDSQVDYTIPDYGNNDQNYQSLSQNNKSQNIVDYIWFRKKDPNAQWSIRTYAVNYPWSDHRPVIGIYIRN